MAVWLSSSLSWPVIFNTADRIFSNSAAMMSWETIPGEAVIGLGDLHARAGQFQLHVFYHRAEEWPALPHRLQLLQRLWIIFYFFFNGRAGAIPARQGCSGSGSRRRPRGMARRSSNCNSPAETLETGREAMGKLPMCYAMGVDCLYHGQNAGSSMSLR